MNSASPSTKEHQLSDNSPVAASMDPSEDPSVEAVINLEKANENGADHSNSQATITQKGNESLYQSAQEELVVKDECLDYDEVVYFSRNN